MLSHLRIRFAAFEITGRETTDDRVCYNKIIVNIEIDSDSNLITLWCGNFSTKAILFTAIRGLTALLSINLSRGERNYGQADDQYHYLSHFK